MVVFYTKKERKSQITYTVRIFALPGLHIMIKQNDESISCGKCNKVCPMGVDVVKSVKDGSIKSLECIQCGACIDNCPGRVLAYGMKQRKETNGK